MPNIVVYARAACPYCIRAKDLLKAKGVAFTEIDIVAAPEKRAEMIERSGGRATVPQIFIDERHIGGCDDLHALDAQGRLDPLLARTPS